jgi:serine/threonine protein phosphatase PrpC
MVEAGYLQPHELRSSPERSKLLNALGDRDGFEPSVEPAAFPIQGHDKFLMCTDGLWEYVEEKELEETIAESTSAEEWLRVLESRVLSRGRTNQDNYSALAVWCKP